MAEVVVKKGASLREQVIEAIFHDLSTGTLVPGQRVTEEGLARRLNVSRTPIREGLAKLTSQGTLLSRDGGGYLVPSPTPAEVRDMIAVRKILEGPAIRIAAEEFGQEEIDVLTEALVREEEALGAKSGLRFVDAIEDFRNGIFQSIANKALSTAIAQFNTSMHLLSSAALSEVKIRRVIVRHHVSVRDAIQAHNADLAERLWIGYLDDAGRVLVAEIANWTSKLPSE